MATSTRTSAPRKPDAGTKTATPGRARKTATKSAVEKASEAVTGSAATLIDAVKASPIASAAIVAGVAGAGALLWSKRGEIAEQAGAIGDKASEFGGKLGARASGIGEKLSDQASAIGDKVSDRYAAATGETPKSQQEIAEEALSLKQTGDSVVAEQSKVGAVAY